MKKLLWLILILILAFPVMAQDFDAAYEPLQVSNVRLRLSEEDGASLIFNATPAVCAPLITNINIEGEFIDIDVYAPPADANMACTTIVPFEPVLELGDLEVDTFYKLSLNDFSTLFFLPRPDGIIMDVQFPMTWGEDNALFGFNRVDSTLENIEVSISENNTIAVQLTGYHPDGCETETYTRVHQDELDSMLHHVDIFRLVPDGVMCPAMLQEFDITLDTGVSADEATLFQVGQLLYSYDPEAMNADEIMRVFIGIESVEINENGNRYNIDVMGTRNGDCGVELQELVTETEYASFIQIFDDVPPVAACTMDLIFYQNTFAVSALPVIINGVAYDENGIIELGAEASSAENTGDGNFMKVDTVIENVEVVILESFPMQLHLTVSGYQPDGCQLPVIVEQQRDGNNVIVHIYREMPADTMCPAMVVSYEDTIVLEGSFEFGAVHIEVNDYIIDMEL